MLISKYCVISPSSLKSLDSDSKLKSGFVEWKREQYLI